MSNVFTLIDDSSSKAFLEEKRKDPVTGETFTEGDRVVFCAVCKSAFHLDSWIYIKGQHCGQHETLDAMPSDNKTPMVLSFEEGKVSYESPELIHPYIRGGRKAPFSLVYASSVAAVLLGFGLKAGIFSLLILFFLNGFFDKISLKIFKPDNMRWPLHILRHKRLRIQEKALVIENDWVQARNETYRFSQIESVHYFFDSKKAPKMKFQPLRRLYHARKLDVLEIRLKDGKHKLVNMTKLRHKRSRRDFLVALAALSHKVPVSIHTENTDEMEFLDTLATHYNVYADIFFE